MSASATPDSELTLSFERQRAVASPWGAALRRYFFAEGRWGQFLTLHRPIYHQRSTPLVSTELALRQVQRQELTLLFALCLQDQTPFLRPLFIDLPVLLMRELPLQIF